MRIKSKSHRIIVGLAAVAIGIALSLTLVLWQGDQDTKRNDDMREQAASFENNAVVPPRGGKIGGDFTLTDMNGRVVHDTDFRGKYMLVYFGYTYCPDMCPTGLQAMGRVLDRLGEEAGKVAALFVTVDPKRDTPEKLREYCASFHPQILGLSGTEEQTRGVADAYQAYYAKGEQVEGQDYLMDHSSSIYLMDQQGNFVSTFDENADPQKIMDALRDAMGKAGTAH